MGGIDGLTTTPVGVSATRVGYHNGADGREVAVGRTVQVAYDYAGGKTVPLADDVRAKLEGR